MVLGPGIILVMVLGPSTIWSWSFIWSWVLVLSWYCMVLGPSINLVLYGLGSWYYPGNGLGSWYYMVLGPGIILVLYGLGS